MENYESNEIKSQYVQFTSSHLKIMKMIIFTKKKQQEEKKQLQALHIEKKRNEQVIINNK